MTRRTYDSLRSARWFAPDDFRSFGHRSRVLQMGYGYEDWKGKPIIAIAALIGIGLASTKLTAMNGIRE